MPDVIVIGDGPGGMSAALFLAKNKVDTVVFGDDKSAMNWALLRNYLGLPEILGTEFQKTARAQVEAVGARLRADRVASLSESDGRWQVALEGGEKLSAKYLILSEGKGPRLAKQLGLEFDDKLGIATDRNAKTKLDGVYVVGRSARPGRSQAIISAGDGAAAAIDILSREKGEDFLDWDEPPKS
ncbi:MAG: NAD(P)/FAD-dependent oxidoreductase [Deltaproteobacteria bacterium]|nr:NAD(P)/FAD-dependent oxidoreductase [Deltaproteobacteria bacterium]MCW5803536.1 NAD(P)/FAD-dependent oxidoreductase [Deltaproteobacteria bacterium]